MSTTHTARGRIKKTLRSSILDGGCHSAMLGFTQSYVTPFALALKATTAQIGLLSSIPNMVMALSQLAAPYLARRAGSRKRLILPVVLMHALMWIPILLVPFLCQSGAVWWLICFVALGTLFGSISNPAWGSMMADLVPENTRGRYFSHRTRVGDLAMLAASFAAGGILQLTTGKPFLGFSVVFGSAVAFRLASWYFLSRMYEPPFVVQTTRRVAREHSRKRGPSSHLRRLAAYVSLINFATCLCGPFFAVYMLRDLKFDYLTYVGVNATSTIATIIFLSVWGKRADRAGNVRIIKVTSCLIPLVPLLWLVSKQVYYLLLVQAIAGLAWSGFNLATTNFLYDSSAREARTKSIAVFNAVNGMAMCLGSLVGGYLAPRLPLLNGSNLLTLFLVSGLLRMAIVLSPLRRLSEVRRVPRISTRELLFGKPRLLWIGMRNRVAPVLGPEPMLTASPAVVTAVAAAASWAHSAAAPSRSPPVLDDS